jgi:hypothetical protein
VPAIVNTVALVAVTVNVDELPATIDFGSAAILTEGATMAVTVTVVEAETLEPFPTAVAV